MEWYYVSPNIVTDLQMRRSGLSASAELLVYFYRRSAATVYR